MFCLNKIQIGNQNLFIQTKKIYLFKNYIKKSLVEKIESQLNKTNLYASDKNLIDWYEGKMTESPEGLIDVWEEISILIVTCVFLFLIIESFFIV